MKQLLRNLKVLEGPFPAFDYAHTPPSPHELFIEWLKLAIEQGVREPHAMTLSTIRSDDQPDARVLILKNIDHLGWYFASSGESNKGKQLKRKNSVALTFYWPEQGRQVRIVGHAHKADDELRKKDFLARSEMARAGALIGKQSSLLHRREEIDEALAVQQEVVRANPDIMYDEWMLYVVNATEVEFWQGDQDRKHLRVKYYKANNGWNKQLLWP